MCVELSWIICVNDIYFNIFLEVDGYSLLLGHELSYSSLEKQENYHFISQVINVNHITLQILKIKHMVPKYDQHFILKV